jgi:C4-type Zn-finger protein
MSEKIGNPLCPLCQEELRTTESETGRGEAVELYLSLSCHKCSYRWSGWSGKGEVDVR